MARRFFEGAAHAAAYAKFRPQPPENLIKHIYSYLRDKYQGALVAAADVGCGTGQSSQVLTPYFKCVTGLDVSAAQISEAVKQNTSSKVSFKVSGAENLPFPDQSLHLVTAGQACHWFDLPQFFREVDRVLVPGGVLALYGYAFPVPIHGNVSDKLKEAVEHMYSVQLGGYVLDESKEVYIGNYTSQKYKLIYDDQVEARDDTYYVDKEATVAELTGYISSWSGFQNFRTKNGDDAAMQMLDRFQNRIMSTLDVTTSPDETVICLRFQYFLLLGRKPF